MTTDQTSRTGGPGRQFLARLREGDHSSLALACLAYLLVVSLFFSLFPAVDIAASALFHRAGEGFPLAADPFFMRLRELGPFLVKLVAGTSLALLGACLLAGRAPAWLSLRAPVFLLSTLILGPGLVVNALFKDNWGRPRPNAVDLFGGEAPYVPVWRISEHCDKNCSFVSGEASSSLWLVTLAFIAPPAWRRGILVFVLPLVVALSANRVAFGGHFLSDTLISWGVTLLVILAVHAVLYRWGFLTARAPAWRRAVLRSGAGIRQAIATRLVAGSRAWRNFLATMR